MCRATLLLCPVLLSSTRGLPVDVRTAPLSIASTRNHNQALNQLSSLPPSQTYGMNGENLSVSTKKLGAVSLSLQKGIQARWCNNTYDGQGTTKLPAGVLQLVVELIVAAKGLFSLLNRFVWRGWLFCNGLGVVLCRDKTDKCLLSWGSNSQRALWFRL